MATNLKPGDIVRLNSGGPKMTALRVSNHSSDNWDFLFFYDESHGPVEPKILHDVPETCVVLVDKME